MKSTLKLTLLSTAALGVAMTAGPLIAASETGTRLFTFDTVPDHVFAMLPGDKGESALVCLTAVDHGFKVIGLGDVFGQEIMFADAEMLTGGAVIEIEGSDFVQNGTANLALPLVETLLQLAAAGLGDVRKADLILGDQTALMLSDKGSVNLTVFRFGKEAYGVYSSPDKIQVVALAAGTDQQSLRVTAILGAVPTGNTKHVQAGTAATPVGTDQQSLREREAVAA